MNWEAETINELDELEFKKFHSCLKLNWKVGFRFRLTNLENKVKFTIEVEDEVVTTRLDKQALFWMLGEEGNSIELDPGVKNE